MRKEQKERLHEDDRFVKTVSAAWDKVLERRTMVLTTLAVVSVVFITVAVFAGLREVQSRRALDALAAAETIEEMEAASESYPRAAELLLRLARQYHERGEEGDLERAQQTLERAAKAADTDLLRGLTDFALGKVKKDRGHHEQALEHLDAALRNHRTRPIVGNEATFLAGRCLELLGRHEEASERYITLREERQSVWQQLAEYRLTKLRQDGLM